MRRLALITALFCAPLLLTAQPPAALMNAQQTNEFMARSLQLMEAAAVATPEMSRAGAPVVESARQASVNLRQRAGNTAFTYAFLTSLRAYVLLSDSVPKPYPFPQEAARQLNELRDNLARFDSHFRSLLDQRESQLRSPDRDNLRRYNEANKLVGPPRAAKQRVVFMGDSITDSWRLNEYFPDEDFINRGISGQITSEMLGRFKADVLDLNPAAVLILGGTNDLARGVNLIAIEDYYTMMADLADKHKIKMIWASVLPVSDYHKDQNPAWEMTKVRPPIYIRALNDWLKNLCEQRGYTYLDYYSALADNTGMLKADLADDGLHPNSAGYRVMAPLAMEAVRKTVGGPAAVTQKPAKKKGLFGRSE
jgi:lysophospholipase L1-like esterase